MNISSLYIAGCGDVGRRVAALAVEKGIMVCALSRGNKVQHEIEMAGVESRRCNLDDPETLAGMDLKGSALLYSAPPPGGGVCDTRAANFLASLAPGKEPLKIIYLSTTGVYGECGDQLVTEERPVNPTSHAARRRLDAEERFRAWCNERGVALVILRVAGIYGPGRVPFQRILANEPLLNEQQAGFTNRVHADDLSRICVAALERGDDGDIFNVCDGESGKMTDYFNAITDLMGLPRLPQVSLEEARTVLSPLMFTYMTESRKVSNRKMLEKLGIDLKYKNMLEGLKESINAFTAMADKTRE